MKLSVAMAVYNGEKYLEEQLESILNQSMPVDEVVIVIDGSHDGSEAIVDRFSQKCGIIKKVVNEANLGYRKSFARALENTIGDIVFLCDQDDRWHKNKVEVMVNTLKEDESISVLASSFSFMNADSQVYQVRQLPHRSNNNLYTKEVAKGALVPVTFEEFRQNNYFQGCALALRRGAVEDYLAHFSDDLTHDWLINLLASKKNGVRFLNVPLFDYRIHGSNAIGVPGASNRNADIRLDVVKNGWAVNKFIRETWPDYAAAHPECEGLEKLCEEHYEALKDGKVWTVIKENANPYYRQFKAFPARMKDIWYACRRKKR